MLKCIKCTLEKQPSSACSILNIYKILRRWWCSSLLAVSKQRNFKCCVIWLTEAHITIQDLFFVQLGSAPVWKFELMEVSRPIRVSCTFCDSFSRPWLSSCLLRFSSSTFPLPPPTSALPPSMSHFPFLYFCLLHSFFIPSSY